MNLNDLRTSASSLSGEKQKKQTMISINDLVPSKLNAKIFIVRDDLKESIKELGLLESFTVKRLPNGKYEVLSGNRRFTSLKALVKKDPDFKYKWVQGDNTVYYSPLTDGIPCKIVENDLSKADEMKIILGSNDHRKYDKLDIYNCVMEWKNLYKEEGYEGKLNERIAENSPVESRTIADILADNWLISSKNYKDVSKCGSYEQYTIKLTEEMASGKGPAPKPKMDNFNKEYAYQDKIQKHHEKIDFDKLDIKNEYYDDLRKNAIRMIQTVMDAYNISSKEL